WPDRTPSARTCPPKMILPGGGGPFREETTSNGRIFIRMIPSAEKAPRMRTYGDTAPQHNVRSPSFHLEESHADGKKLGSSDPNRHNHLSTYQVRPDPPSR